MSNWPEVKARLMAAKRIGTSSKVAVEVMDLTDALEEIERLEVELADARRELNLVRSGVFK